MLMKKNLTVIIVIMLAVSFLGCLDAPSPPGANLPELVIHQPEDNENETVINIQTLELVMFDEITLYLNDTETNETQKARWNNSFGPEYRTELSKFNLNIFVRHEEGKYRLNATFELFPDEGIPEDEYEDEELIYRITYHDGDGEERYISRDDLPILEPLNPMEDAE